VDAFNIFTVVVHIVSALTILGLVASNGDVVYTLTHNVVTFVPPKKGVPITQNMTAIHSFGNVTIYSHIDKTNLHLSLGTMIVLFFTLSAFFQLAFATSQSRYVEYSFSGSLVMIVVLLQVGIYDAHTIFAMTILGIVMNMLGYLADLAFFGENFWVNDPRVYADSAPVDPVEKNRLESDTPKTDFENEELIKENESTVPPHKKRAHRKIAFIAHFLGWVAFLPIITSFLAAYITVVHSTANKPPEFVTYIVSLEAVLLTAFGVAQILSFTKYMRTNPNYIHCTFITLSLLAKTLLGWILAAELIIP
jgi:hypothetical protein